MDLDLDGGEMDLPVGPFLDADIEEEEVNEEFEINEGFSSGLNFPS